MKQLKFYIINLTSKRFLDDTKAEVQIRKQFAHTISFIHKHSYRIIIGYLYPVTIYVLQQTSFKLPNDIELVSVNTLLNNNIKDKLASYTVRLNPEKISARYLWTLLKFVNGYREILPFTKVLFDIDLIIYFIDTMYLDLDLKNYLLNRESYCFVKFLSF